MVASIIGMALKEDGQRAHRAEAVMAKRITRIMIETQSILIIRGATPVRASGCLRCSAEVETVVLETAGVLAQVDHTTVRVQTMLSL